MRLIKKSALAVIRDGILHLKKTSYGKQVSINMVKKDRIIEYVDEFLKME